MTLPQWAAIANAVLVVSCVVIVAAWVRGARSSVPTRDPVAELLRWHAAWERDHPDLIVHASYTDYLPTHPAPPPFDPDPDLIEHKPLFGLIRPYGGKRGGVDTSALIARFNEADRGGKPMILPKGMTYERFSTGDCKHDTTTRWDDGHVDCVDCGERSRWGFSPGGYIPGPGHHGGQQTRSLGHPVARRPKINRGGGQQEIRRPVKGTPIPPPPPGRASRNLKSPDEPSPEY